MTDHELAQQFIEDVFGPKGYAGPLFFEDVVIMPSDMETGGLNHPIDEFLDYE